MSVLSMQTAILYQQPVRVKQVRDTNESESALEGNNLFRKTVQVIAQRNCRATVILNADKMMQIFLQFSRVRWEHRYGNNSCLEAG